MLDWIRSGLAREEGQALVEYALIVSLVALVTDIINGAAGSL